MRGSLGLPGSGGELYSPIPPNGPRCRPQRPPSKTDGDFLPRSAANHDRPVGLCLLPADGSLPLEADPAISLSLWEGNRWSGIFPFNSPLRLFRHPVTDEPIIYAGRADALATYAGLSPSTSKNHRLPRLSMGAAMEPPRPIHRLRLGRNAFPSRLLILVGASPSSRPKSST